MAGVTSFLEPGRLQWEEDSGRDGSLSLAVLEVTMKNLVLANKNQLFIIRLTESQLPLCDCQLDRQTETDNERDRERKDAFSLLLKVFFPVWQGMGDVWLRQY